MTRLVRRATGAPVGPAMPMTRLVQCAPGAPAVQLCWRPAGPGGAGDPNGPARAGDPQGPEAAADPLDGGAVTPSEVKIPASRRSLRGPWRPASATCSRPAGSRCRSSSGPSGRLERLPTTPFHCTGSRCRGSSEPTGRPERLPTAPWIAMPQQLRTVRSTGVTANDTHPEGGRHEGPIPGNT